MSDESSPPPKPSLGDRLATAFISFVRAAVRLTIILIVIAGLGLALFYGLPLLYSQYIEPVEENSMRLDELEFQQEQANLALTQSAAAWQDRLATLEAQSTANADTLTTLQDQLSAAASTLQAGLSETDISPSVSLEQLSAIETALADLASALEELEANTGENNTALQTLSADYYTQASPLATLHRELMMIKAMELLTRSRISLIQQNLELARQDVQAARDLLAVLVEDVPSHQVDTVMEILGRLDLALANIDVAPELVADDLEVAWQLLMFGLPGDPLSEAASTSALTHSATHTPMPTPTGTTHATPTPTAIPYPYP